MTNGTSRGLTEAVVLGDQPDLSAELAELQQRLHRTAAIEQAKGILMGHYGISEDAAFAVLHRWSSHTNVKISRLSESLAAAVVAEPDNPRGAVAQLVHDLEARGGPPR